MIILTLLKLLKPIKTDRKSIVDSGSLDITSGSLLKWPFMPKQGPRSSSVQYCTVLHSTVQCCTVLYSIVQYCTVLYGNYHPSVQDDSFNVNYHPGVQKLSS